MMGMLTLMVVVVWWLVRVEISTLCDNCQMQAMMMQSAIDVMVKKVTR